MRMRKVFRAVLGLLVLAGCTNAYQSALSKFEQARYQTVIPEFEAYLLQHPEQAGQINYLIAESYRRSNRPERAIAYYEKAIQMPDLAERTRDSALYFYGYALKAAEQYDLALGKFQWYADSGSNYNLREQASMEVQAITSIDTLFEKNKYLNVYRLDSLNTAEDDFSPVFLDKNTLIFSSSRRKESVFETNGQGFQDLYQLKIADADSLWGETTPFGGTYFSQEGVHEASATFSPDGKTMIFARSGSGQKKDPETEVSLYISRYQGQLWTRPELLTGISRINTEGKNRWESTPFLAQDGKTLYFASNRTDYTNEGGIDLFKATFDEQSGTFLNIENLGPSINTPGNELFPYVDAEGTFYFASDGHGGLGGLDIYRVKKNGKPENLGRPINSGADDFGIWFEDKDQGLFCSNRPSGKGGDDIYRFVREEPPRQVVYYLRGIAYGKDPYTGRKTPLPAAQIQMKDNMGNDFGTLTTDASGKFNFVQPVLIGNEYTLKAQEERHLPAQTSYSTAGKGIDTTKLTQELTEVYFDTELTLTRNLLQTREDMPPPEIEILYELDRSRLTEESKQRLDQFVVFLNEFLKVYPDVMIEMGSHTDERGSRTYNQRLSEARAKSAVDYIIAKGIPAEDIRAKGYGEDEPKIPNARTEEEHQLNRRTTVKVFKKK
ncbi:MAG: OmpA family protein [Bernardetiaceae bacterium]